MAKVEPVLKNPELSIKIMSDILQHGEILEQVNGSADKSYVASLYAKGWTAY
jgi:hypothetical protein